MPSWGLIIAGAGLVVSVLGGLAAILALIVRLTWQVGQYVRTTELRLAKIDGKLDLLFERTGRLEDKATNNYVVHPNSNATQEIV